jgi:chemotaxis signal transduction protein
MTVIENAGANSYVLLQVGKQRFALSADIVAELAPPVRLHTIPHTSPLVSGVIVRRGHIVPVYDAAPVLGATSSFSHRFYLIARRDFDGATELSAIPVNGECELATGEVLPPREGRPECVTGTLTIGEEVLDVLDFEKLVTSLPAEKNAPVSMEPRQ